MLNLGGPQTLEDVGPFLQNLFADRELIKLPAQNLLGPFIARMRTHHVQANYQAIGGGSPLLKWTSLQGNGMAKWLDQLSPETAPHKFYVAFRYTHPFSEDALLAMQRDGIQQAVAFTQYPHWSCSTTGSSLNELWRAARQLGLEKTFTWRIIDRWPVHPGFVAAMARSVVAGLAHFDRANRDQVTLLFSAHSLPLDVINRGDTYPQEISASVQAVIDHLNLPNRFLLAYQSQVGPVPWLGPSTAKVIQGMGAQGHKQVLVVPIAFTSDHIETLFEIDVEFGELARHAGIAQFKRTPAINDDPQFQRALAEIVLEHLNRKRPYSSQYLLRCPGCTNPACGEILNPIEDAQAQQEVSGLEITAAD
jgi:ferrochelatase